MSKRTTKTTTKTIAPKLLDEETSARVIAEYLSIEEVAEPEIDAILNRGTARGPRDIALTFRVSEVLHIPAPFLIAPRYAYAMSRARQHIMFLKVIAEREATAAQTEARS